ncbi:MAG: LysR family transcriptional regulator, partial [Pseudomonadales bacterium]
MKLSNIDLNLFVVFDAIYTEGNLTRAGEIIGITQPAVSNSLSRLRKLFDDPLFVRTAEGMVPTPVAQNIIGPVRQALGLMRSSVQENEEFDPSRSNKRFRVSMTDLSQAIILPYLFGRIKREAPLLAIDCYHVHRRDLNVELASGNLDFAVDIPLTPDPQIRQAPLFSHPHVCVVR